MKCLLRSTAAAVLIAAAFLTSCSTGVVKREKTPEEAMTAVTFDASAPVPQAKREPFAERSLPRGDAGEERGSVWIDGQLLGGYYTVGGDLYVAFEKGLEALGLSREEKDGGFLVRIGEAEVYVSQMLGGIFREGQLVGPVFDDAQKGLMAPLKVFTGGGGYRSLEAEGNLYFTRTVTVTAGVRVPVLMYHAVSDHTWGIRELFVSPSEMEKQLRYLTEHGYTTITFEDLGDLSSIRKPVMLTFDDGYRDNYEELFPLLKKYGCKATVFMIAGKEGQERYLTAAMIREMSDSGLVSIQSHTMTHPKLGELSAEKQREELRLAQTTLAGWTHRVPFVLCYPSGSYNDATRTIGAEYYSFGIRMNGGRWNTAGDPFLVPRYYVSRGTTLSAFAGMIG